MISNAISKFEIYFVPVCFILGLIGNLLGTLTILSANKLRKRTNFFILAIIGITDSILLSSQMQRWLAMNLDEQFYLINNSLCKFYLLLVRSSVLITSSLLLAITVTSVIRLYLGAIRLSTHSKLGQIMSKLCVLISFALSMSVSWHELWTSGLRNSTQSIHLIEIQDEEGFEIGSNLPPVTESDVLICSKNIDSILIIEIINYIYFIICILINLFLIFNSVLICIKLNRVNFCSKLCNDTIIIIDKSRIEQQNESTININYIANDPSSLAIKSSFNRTYGTDSNLNTSFSFDNTRETQPTTSKNSIHNYSNKPSITKQFNHVNIKNANSKIFNHYIVLVALVSSFFCLPFLIFDLVYYTDVLVDTIQLNNSTTNQTTIGTQESTIRLPLILINIPHMIKFYVLFGFSSKFRSQVSRLTHLKLYCNSEIIRTSLFRNATPTSSMKSSTFSNRIKKKEISSAYIDYENEADENSNIVSSDLNNLSPPIGLINQNNGKNLHRTVTNISFKRKTKNEKIQFKFNFYPNCLPFLSK